VSVGHGVGVTVGVRVGRGVQVGVGGGMRVGVRVGVAVGHTSGVAVGVKVGRKVGAGPAGAPATLSPRPAHGPKVITAKTRPVMTTPFSASNSAISVIHCQGLKLGILTAATGLSEK